ncbi:hypothetical protein AB0F03_22405 [Streptomyces sp. NPDC028722]|uniref:GHMP family kinase ATP-binding protein n=1 Tax=Streptomyces sp. NPDC028722 TaxID=3155016 RepID=UPI0033CBBF19
MTAVHSSAPMRLSIAGGGTDLPESYRHGPTTVVAAALTHRVHVCAADRPQRAFGALDRALAPADRAFVQPPEEAARHAYPRAAAALLGLATLPAVAVASPVLPGSGLGGSGAYCVALLDALARWSGQPLTAQRAARLAYRLEREVLGRTVGQQDAWAAALGGAQRIRLAPDGSVEAAHSQELYDALGRLIDTGLALYRTQDSRDASRVLAEAPEVTSDGHRAAVAAAARTEQAFRSGDLAVVGATLREHWARKTAANPAADHPVCRRITAGADEHAVLGFKLTGAGGGGHLLIAVDPARHADAHAFLAGLGLTHVPLRPSIQGLHGATLPDPGRPSEEDACASA